MNPPTTPSELATTSSGTETLYPSNNTTQWGHQETVELIKIRGQLEKNFSSSKRFKALWETVASSLRDKGFFRTPHQCKSKWKNLVNRYKEDLNHSMACTSELPTKTHSSNISPTIKQMGKETSDFENGKQCPYFEELRAVFTDRAERLQQSFMDSQQVAVKSRKRSGAQFSDDLSQDDDEEGDDSIREGGLRNNSQKRKTDKNSRGSSSILEMLRGFLQQQERVELQWMESMERNQRERELFELEWRQSMEKLERERLMMEQAWMEREEQRLIREEIRAEKRDALLTSLLNKLIGQGNV